MQKIHLDTDLGGDTDDLCALAMLLKWPNIEITGITTVAEENGRRAGYVKYALSLAGREDLPVKAGADVSGAEQPVLTQFLFNGQVPLVNPWNPTNGLKR